VSREAGGGRRPLGEPRLPSAPSRLPVVLAFLVIYLIWGSTFLAMRSAVAEIPASILVCIRCFGGAAILLGWARWQGGGSSRADWTGSMIAGGLFFLTGQGLLAYGLRFIPSGTSAVFLATIPLWIVLFGALIDRRAPSWLTMVGCVVGLAGVAILALIRVEGGLEEWSPLGTAALLLSSVSWAAGTEFSRRRRTSEDPLSRTGRQLLCGGVFLLAVAVLKGDLAAWSPTQIGAETIGAMVFLIVCGTALGFGAYSWLLRVVRPAVVSTYAFVNPVVALILGWALAGEPLTPVLLGASGVVLAAVAIVILSPSSEQGAGSREQGAGSR